MSEQRPAHPPASPGQTTEVVVDDSSTLPSYSNFCRVTATPEEVILDFGLNPQPFATGRQDVKANQRIVMNFYTAKRLLTALGMTIQRHEGTFGSIELDVRRRATGASSVPAARPCRPPGRGRVRRIPARSRLLFIARRSAWSVNLEPVQVIKARQTQPSLLGHLAPSWLFSHPIAIPSSSLIGPARTREACSGGSLHQ